MSSTGLRIRRPRHGEALPRRARFLGELWRRPAGVFGLVVVACLVLVVALAPSLAPYGEAQQDIPNRLQAPTTRHLLGTDHLGRDLLSRVIFGTRIALEIALPAVFGACLLGLVLGMIAGYLGGWVDSLVLVLLDTLQAFPTVLLILALLALLGPSVQNVVIVIALTFAPGYARVARAQVLSVKEQPFVEVERSLGAGDLRIALIHIVPNVLAPLLIKLAMDLPGAITIEAGLSFLGLGVKPPTPSWGIILADGFSRIRTSPWAVLWPCLILMVTTLGFTLLGETLRDVLDPRLAGTRST